MSAPEVTVVIPFHAQRRLNGLLYRAVASVEAQTVPCKIIVQEDVDRSGAATTRTRGLSQVDTPWTAFLDSDDELDPDHVEKLLKCAAETGADYVYPWFRVIGGVDPFPMFFGRVFDPEVPNSTTITILVRTELAQRLGFHGPWEDWTFVNECIGEGAKIVHLPERTWTWHHHPENTSGRSDRT